MSELRTTYQNQTNEELLKRRALGKDGLSEEAHKVIEDILNERGVVAPPIPQKTIDLTPPKQGSKFLAILVGALAMVFVEGLNHLLKGSVVGVGIAIGGVIFVLVKRISDSSKTNEQKLDDKLVQSEGFTELMYCSVKGDLTRAIELVEYGVDINKQDMKGTTALMYAISNNHKDIVKYLLERGANVHLKTNKGNTALSFAEKYGDVEIKQILHKSNL